MDAWMFSLFPWLEGALNQSRNSARAQTSNKPCAEVQLYGIALQPVTYGHVIGKLYGTDTCRSSEAEFHDLALRRNCSCLALTYRLRVLWHLCFLEPCVASKEDQGHRTLSPCSSLWPVGLQKSLGPAAAFASQRRPVR